MSFEQARVEQHVGYHNGRTAGYRHRGTGLGTPGLINGREATDDEAAAQARAYQRSLDAVGEQLRIPAWRIPAQWDAIDAALKKVRRG